MPDFQTPSAAGALPAFATDDTLDRLARVEEPWMGYPLTFHGDALGCKTADLAHDLQTLRAFVRELARGPHGGQDLGLWSCAMMVKAKYLTPQEAQPAAGRSG